jgi:hypothetical protein
MYTDANRVRFFPGSLLAVPFFVGWRLTPYPTYGPCHCELKISTLSPWLLKLPVLVASKSPGGDAAYRGYSTMRFGSPEKAQRAASGKYT